MHINKNYLSLVIWVAFLILIGSVLGILTKSNIDNWYMTLNRSPLTPPNYVFSIVWTILYALIAVSGSLIWRSNSFEKLSSIKTMYIVQLILNWMWTPLFFSYHLTGLALVCLSAIIILVAWIILKAYKSINLVPALLMPYLLWLLLAAHLNFYVWKYN